MNDNPQLALAYHYVQYTRRNIFLTGKAGTGKTTFLRNLQQHTRKRLIVVAPTGVAAINAGGVTIHSFFQIAPGLFLPDAVHSNQEQRRQYALSKQKINILRTLDLLIIDEISMVRCDLLDAIDAVLRRFQDHYKPFGGVQLLMIGDLQQLAPVTADNEWPILQQHGYRSPYFFGSLALQQSSYITIELTQVYRQTDATFVDMLNEVRDGNVSPHTLAALNARVDPTFRPRQGEEYITLTTHNAQASNINAHHLMMLSTPECRYRAKVSGDFPEAAYPTEEWLTLKVGAQVMFCKNDPQKTYYNGKIGRVVSCENDRVWVECTQDDGVTTERLVVTPTTWDNTKYSTDAATGTIKEETVGSFAQIPLKTAWAITIHKSQGLTFTHAIIEADMAFSPGQVYVALSRCRTLEGMVLTRPIPASVITVDSQVRAFNEYASQHRPDAQSLALDKQRCIYEMLEDLFNFNDLVFALQDLERLARRCYIRLYPNYLNTLQNTLSSFENADDSPYRVGQRFCKQLPLYFQQGIPFADDEALKTRLVNGAKWSLNQTTERLQDIIDAGVYHIDNQKDKEQLTLAFERLSIAYKVKTAVLTACLQGFSLDAYWDAKATATMKDDNKKTTARSRKTSAEKETVTVVKRKKIATAESEEKPAQKTSSLASTDIARPALYQALTNWRKEKAAQLGVPAFMLLHNTALLALTNTLPRTQKEMTQIPGISLRIFRAFGQELLQLIEQYAPSEV